jgi:hypothetical protein
MGCAVTDVSVPEPALAALRQQPYELAFLAELARERKAYVEARVYLKSQ